MKGKEYDSIVYEPFQCRVEVLSVTKQLVSSIEDLKLRKKLEGGEPDSIQAEEWVESLAPSTPFIFLRVDLPPCPLFRDSHGGLVIPQLPLFEALKRKFDGHSFTDHVTQEAHVRKR